MLQRLFSLLILTLFLFLSACSDGDGSSDNIAPTVEAGDDQSVVGGTLVALEATASDSDGSIVSYAWAQPGGSAVTLATTDSAATRFTGPVVTEAEILSFSVTVTDDLGATATDTVAIALNPSQLNDTGIDFCHTYNGSAWSSGTCTGTGTGDGQDAYYGRDADASTNTPDDGQAGFSFTKIDSSGSVTTSTTVGDWDCVQDEVTGLMWEVKSADSASLSYNGNTYSWYNSDATTNGGDAGTENNGTCTDTGNCDTEKFTAQVNAVGLCGYSDWRLPTITELQSIVHYGVYSPAIDTVYFPNTPQSGSYWSSSPYAYYSTDGWLLDFSWGYADFNSKSGSLYVRLVRGQ